MVNKNFNSYDLFILKILYNAGQNAEIILDYLAVAKLILLLPLTVFYVNIIGFISAAPIPSFSLTLTQSSGEMGQNQPCGTKRMELVPYLFQWIEMRIHFKLPHPPLLNPRFRNQLSSQYL